MVSQGVSSFVQAWAPISSPACKRESTLNVKLETTQLCSLPSHMISFQHSQRRRTNRSARRRMRPSSPLNGQALQATRSKQKRYLWWQTLGWCLKGRKLGVSFSRFNRPQLNNSFHRVPGVAFLLINPLESKLKWSTFPRRPSFTFFSRAW